MANKFDAIQALEPEAEFSIDGETLIWHSDSIQQPTEEAINQKMAEMDAEYENNEYARNRAVAYPSIGDQLDALFHAGVFPEDMAATIQAVKDKYPKPTE